MGVLRWTGLATLLALGLLRQALAEPIADESRMHVERSPPHHRLWQGESHDEAASAAEQAAIDVLLHGQVVLDRLAILEHTYLGRPPTWIQNAATVNLAEFPSLADPTEDAEREMGIIEDLARERARSRAEAARDAARDGALPGEVAHPGEDVPDWLRPLLPGHWLPLVREHRYAIVGGGVALLLASWLLKLLARHARARARRKRDRRRRGRHRHWQTPEPALQGATPSSPIDAVPIAARARRSGRHRSRRSDHHGTGAHGPADR